MTDSSPYPQFYLRPDDDRYPKALLENLESPPVIYGVGNDPASLGRGIGIIGSRTATPYGLKVAHLVAGWAAELGLTVYSGCARGCDQAAHLGALDSGGRTVAVLGCGADVTYPARAHAILARIKHTGACISTYGFGVAPMKYRFRERNRIIAALSSVLVVVEAKIPSGTFSAVRHALDMGIPIGAVPGTIFSPQSQAPNQLIMDGAYVISTKEDIQLACHMAFEGSDPDTNDTQDMPSNDEPRIIQALRGSPLAIDELSSVLDMTVVDVTIAVNSYELKGDVIRYPDGRYAVLTKEAIRP